MSKLKNGFLLLPLLLASLGCGGPDAGSADGGPDLPPTVTSTTPAHDATAVPNSARIEAVFSTAMDGATVTDATFFVTQADTTVPGTVTYAGRTATFTPMTELAALTTFTATVTTGLADEHGNALESDVVWEFTTDKLADTTRPFVVSVSNAGDVTATFSELMAASTMTATAFTVTAPGEAPVVGSVNYAGLVATFVSDDGFTPGTLYTATVAGDSAGVTDLEGNTMEEDFTWQFTMKDDSNLAPVLLGGAGQYVILAQSAISTVPTSAITGDVALSPAAASYITGFSLVEATGYATATQVTGKVFAADYVSPTSDKLTVAVTDMGTAYTDAAGRPTPDFLELGTGAIGGLTLSAGLYKWTGTVTIASDVVLEGDATDVWILQIAGDLTQSAGTRVTLRGGAKAENVFWQVAGATQLGTTSHFEGILLCKTEIALQTGASFHGRALAQTAVTLDSNAVTQPTP